MTRSQISLTDSQIELLDEAAEYKGFDKRPPYVMYCVRRDIDEKKSHTISELKLKNNELKSHNIQLEQEIMKKDQELAQLQLKVDTLKKG